MPEVEARLSTERTLDIFTMKPKVCGHIMVAAQGTKAVLSPHSK